MRLFKWFLFLAVGLFGNLLLWAQVPSLPPNSVVNVASFRPATDLNGAIAPGAMVAIFGTDLAGGTLLAGEVPLPTTLGDTSVTFDNIPAPLFFVSGTQINTQVPFELMTGTGMVSVQVKRGSETSAAQPIGIAAVSPGIFTLNQQGTGAGAILHAEDFQPVSDSAPAQPGEFLLIFCTGLGPVQPEVQSGQIAPSTAPLAETLNTPLVNIAGIPANVTFSGLAPGFVGLYQVNVQVPGGVSTGDAVPVVLTIGGVASNTVAIGIAAPSTEVVSYSGTFGMEGNFSRTTLLATCTWIIEVDGSAVLTLVRNGGLVDSSPDFHFEIAKETFG